MATSLGGSSGFMKPGQTTGLKGSGYTSGTMQQFTPEQMSLFQRLFSNVGPDSLTSKLASGDQSTFDQLEKPALKQFNALQGNIASRFSGMGMGGRRSSGFQNAMTTANQDFSSQLRAQRMGLQQQAIQSLHGMSNDLLNQRPYENMLMPQQKPFWQELASAGAGGIGQGIGAGASGFLLGKI